jgi:hypothetical protein
VRLRPGRADCRDAGQIDEEHASPERIPPTPTSIHLHSLR